MKTDLLHSYSSNSLANLGRINIPTGSVFQEGDSTASSCDVSNTGKLPPPGEFISLISKSIFRRKLLYKRLPVLTWYRDYDYQKLLADIISGITVSATILPQGLAYAQIAGLPAQYGLYSGFMGSFLYIFFGGSKIVTIGPTALMSIITLQYSKGNPEYTILLCFLNGLVTFFMGLFQLGFVVNFLSKPVLSGFTSAAAISICSTQIKALLGLTFKADGFRGIIYGTFEHFQEIRMNDSVLAGICIIVLIFMQNLQSIFKTCTKQFPKLDRALWFISTSRSVIVMVICTVIFSILDEGVFPVKVVGHITPGLPPVKLPPFSINQNISGIVVNRSISDLLKEDSSALLVIPLIALMEHITIAKKFTGTKLLDSSQEMISIGLANILGSFFSSIPVTGSFSRSAVNAASGAESPLGGLITGTLVILALEFLTPYFYYIPNASLAAVIISAVIFTVDFEIVVSMWKIKRMDLIPWGVTFCTSLLIGLEIGILSGVSISVIFLLHYAARPAVKVKRAETSMGSEFVIVSLDRSLVFPSTEYSRYMIMKSGDIWGKGLPIVIDCFHINYADYTAAEGIRDLFLLFNEKKQPLILWRVKPSIIRILSGLMENSNVPFKYCIKEDELERMIDGDDDDKPVEFYSSTQLTEVGETPITVSSSIR